MSELAQNSYEQTSEGVHAQEALKAESVREKTGRQMTDIMAGLEALKLKKVAVVDDDPALRAGYECTLGEFCPRLKTYASGDEFLAKGEMPDVLICDCQMPGMQGDEVVRRVAEISPDTQIFMVSGSHRPTDLPPGCCFMPKPFDIKRFVSNISMN